MGYSQPPPPSRVNVLNILLLLVIAAASFIIAEQVATGWLALGDRVNISRRDMNPIEIIVIVVTAIWGLLALRTAWTFISHEVTPRVREYFDDNAAMPPGILLSTAVLALVGIVFVIIGEQILTGWLPLGERINISRRNISFIEWAAIIGSVLWGMVLLWTAFNLWRRDLRAWSYAQWLLLLNAFIGFTALLSGVFDITKLFGERTPINQMLSAIGSKLPDIQNLTAPAALLLLSSLVAYRYLTAELRQKTAQKAIAGSLSERAAARGRGGANTPADISIRNTLARTPGAGAIIGFIFVFTFFSIATDLFLQPQSLTGALTNNITIGIVAIGVTMLMIAGEFDLSVGSQLGVSGLTFLGMQTGHIPMTFVLGAIVIMGLTSFFGSLGLVRRQRALMPMLGLIFGAALLVLAIYIIFVGISGNLPYYVPAISPIPAAIIAMVFTCFLGYINGWILIRTGIPSFIVTLGTQLIFRAIPQVLVDQGNNLRYADYFSQPPYIDISRILIAIAAALGIVGVLYIAKSLIPSLWINYRAKVKDYPNNPNHFRDLHVALSLLNFAITAIAILAGLYLLVGGLLDQLQLLGSGSSMLTISFYDLMNGRILSLPFIGQLQTGITLRMGVFWWLLLVVVFQFLLNRTRYGNSIFAVGGNPGAARAQGINVNRIKISSFVLVSFLISIAAILDVSYVTSVDALRGNGLDLRVIAAAVIGGALLTGGYGSIVGALLGVFIYGSLGTGLVLIGVDNRYFNGVIGFIIIVAVVINTASRRAKT
ncbi:MAG: ABC transporter permease [Anaerolineae bacterium]|nr:ABC transporter permease [Anaerolineae bacterium]